MIRTGGAGFQADAVLASGTDGLIAVGAVDEAFGAFDRGLAAPVNIGFQAGP